MSVAGILGKVQIRSIKYEREWRETKLFPLYIEKLHSDNSKEVFWLLPCHLDSLLYFVTVAEFADTFNTSLEKNVMNSLKQNEYFN